jgi:hypothetical protein
MTLAIDWNFIGRQEGDRLTGYVPDPSTSLSGVTIASGVDLSAQSAASLEGLPGDLRAKLTPYLGLRGSAALAMLARRPLTLTQAQADALDTYIRGDAINALASEYDSQSPVRFAALPPPAQTVIASVAFQYGDIARRCPKFWACIVVQNWTAAHAELMNFGDDYTTRRHAEAAYLAPLIPTV